MESKQVNTFEYHLTAEDVEQAKKIANAFHRKLCGLADYSRDRIILDWSGEEVTLTVFADAETSVKIEHDVYCNPKLLVNGQAAGPEMLEIYIEPTQQNVVDAILDCIRSEKSFKDALDPEFLIKDDGHYAFVMGFETYRQKHDFVEILECRLHGCVSFR